MEIKELFSELKNTRQALTEEIGKRDEQIKANGEANEKTGQKVDELGDRMERIEGELKEAYLANQRPGGAFGGGGPQAKSLGAQFIESEVYKNLGTDRLPSAPVEIKSFFGERKDLSSDAASAGSLAEPQRYPQVVAAPDRADRVRDLMSVQSIQTNSVEYVEETGFTNNAAIVPEGGLKPESDLTFELKSENASTIAHAVRASRQILADATQLQAYINQRLTYGIKLVEDQQLLYGDGTGDNLRGVLTHPDRQQYARIAGDTKIDAIRRAATKAELAEYPADGVVMHQIDWEDIELQKGSDGHYIWITVTQGGQQRLFRMPVVATQAIQQGQAAVGSFSMASTLWDREQASIRVSEHHGDVFLRNQVVILGEERLILTTFRPEAMVDVDLAEPA